MSTINENRIERSGPNEPPALQIVQLPDMLDAATHLLHLIRRSHFTKTPEVVNLANIIEHVILAKQGYLMPSVLGVLGKPIDKVPNEPIIEVVDDLRRRLAVQYASVLIAKGDD